MFFIGVLVSNVPGMSVNCIQLIENISNASGVIAIQHEHFEMRRIYLDLII